MSVKYYSKLIRHQEPEPPAPLTFDFTEPFFIHTDVGSTCTINLMAEMDDMGGTTPTVTVEYSTDKVDWSTLGTTYAGCQFPITITSDKTYFRANTWHWREGMRGNVYFKTYNTSNNIYVGGNVASLRYGSSLTGQEMTLPYGFIGSFIRFQKAIAENLILPTNGEVFAYEISLGFSAFPSDMNHSIVYHGDNPIDTGLTLTSDLQYLNTTIYIPKGTRNLYDNIYGMLGYNNTVIEYDLT